MLILDTNILSELLKPQPDSKVMAWLGNQNGLMVYTSAITVAEIRYGLAIMPKGKRRDELIFQTEEMFKDDFQGRILSFDAKAALYYADISAQRRTNGQPISQSDAMLAAITKMHNMKLATRNIKDFKKLDIPLVNPFDV
jgi:predicted nucleic acid-binding protein